LPLADVSDTIYEGGKPVAEAEGITHLRTDGGKAVFTLLAGHYSFNVRGAGEAPEPEEPKEEEEPDAPTSVGTDAVATLQVYPNPVVAGQFTVENLQKGDKIEIYSISSQLVGVYDAAGEITIVNLAHLPAGAYVVKAGGKAAKIVKN
jgi:hypothetical protein